MLMDSIEMHFQVVRIRENFLANLTRSFIKLTYKENLKGEEKRIEEVKDLNKQILFTMIGICSSFYGIYCCAF